MARVAALLLALLAAGLAVAAAGRAQQQQAPGFCGAASPCQLACGTAACGSTAAAASPAPAASADAPERMSDVIARVVAVAETQVAAAMQALRPDGASRPAAFPDSTTNDGRWGTAVAGRWTCGFFPGVMWQLHALTGKQQWAESARQWQEPLANMQRAWISQLDLGFIYLPSFAHSYSVTRSRADLRQALAAAEALSWAYNPATRSVKSWQGWEPPRATKLYKQVVIIDFTINVLMLAWGARHVGPADEVRALRMDTDPQQEWMDMAIAHARQVAANHVRPDGTTYHIVEYNPDTGSINKRYTYQGLDDNSTWARGQSWALYGLAKMHNETGLPEFLTTAQKVADKWLELLGVQDGAAAGDFVPIWDFNAAYDKATDGPRDSAGAGIAALGMLHLAESLGPRSACGARYLCAAARTLRLLASPKYLAAATPAGGRASDGVGGAPDASFAALLKHGTSNFPGGGGVDAGLIYGDYYYMMALAKCASMEACRSHAS